MTIERKSLIEERCIPEKEGLLGSKITAINSDGSIIKEFTVAFCDSCGQALKGEIAICCCKRKVCPLCSIRHGGKVYCKDCAKQFIALTKEDFFSLYGLANGADLGQVQRASSMTSDSLADSLCMLLERGLIERRGFSVFSRFSVTSKGLSILATCEQIYCNEGDVIRFQLILGEMLDGR